MKLNTRDIEKVKNELKKVGVRNPKLMDEMLDHYCAEVESHISLGIQKSYAINYVLKNINPKSLQPIIRYHQLQNLKKQVFMIALLSLISFLTVIPFFSGTKETSVEIQKQGNVTHRLTPVDDPPYLWPVKSQSDQITSHFGKRMNPITQKIQQHTGIDIKAKSGTIVIAPAAAVVAKVGYNEKEGHFIVLEHDEYYQTKYCHLARSLVETGETIKAGDSIGEVGNSGLSTKPHLHYEVLKNGLNVDPIDYLKT